MVKWRFYSKRPFPVNSVLSSEVSLKCMSEPKIISSFSIIGFKFGNEFAISRKVWKCFFKCYSFLENVWLTNKTPFIKGGQKLAICKIFRPWFLSLWLLELVISIQNIVESLHICHIFYINLISCFSFCSSYSSLFPPAIDIFGNNWRILMFKVS